LIKGYEKRHFVFIMLQIIVYFLLLTSFAFSARAETLPRGDFTALRNTGTAAVTAIVDAQTLQLHDGRFVRLSGVELPDLKEQETGDFAVLAQHILRDMLVGKTVIVHQTKTKNSGRVNRMGQHLAHIERQEDKAWVQGTLLALGLARVRTAVRTPEMAAQMYALERAARDAPLGVWEEAAYGILTPDRAAEAIGHFGLVEGAIISATPKNNRIYLNFGQDWREDFTVSLPPGTKRRFTSAGLDPLQWAGRRVLVRGWLERYNGPMMEINHPAAIIVLDKQPEAAP
jgi:hypothetical protein